MGKTNRFLITFVLALSLLNTGASAVERKTIKSLAEGPPAVAQVLGSDSFVPVEVERLANPAVWYFDYEWHRQHGIEIPPEGIHSPEFAQQVLDAYAWQSHTETDAPHEFTGEKRLSYADYYGGYGMGVNHGSGRAAANGIVQAKGVKTSLAKSTDPWHSNGAVQSIEAVDEAIWSRVLDSELRYGSNKVVAVILTGTYGRNKDNNQVFPRALIIREMALRPAHFMLNYYRDSKLDRARVDQVLPKLADALPYPEGYVRQGPKVDLKVGIYELVDREAITQAEYFAKRMFFGSVSPSNLEITGRRLDLGDHTSQEGYSPIYRLDWQKDSPFGGTKSFKDLFADFIGSLERSAPLEYRMGFYLPSKNKVLERFENTYQNQRRVELVRLTGVPHEILDAHPENAVIQKLGSVLLKVASAGHKQPQFTEPDGWKNLGSYNLNSILVRLAADPAMSIPSLEALLREDFQNDPLKRELASTYFEFRKYLNSQAAPFGLTIGSLETYLKEAASIRNRSRPSLVRGHSRWKTLWETTDAAIHQKSPTPVEDYIQHEAEKNILNYKDTGPFQVVIQQRSKPSEGIQLREVFDAKTGEYASLLRIDISLGEARLLQRQFSIEELQKLSLELKNSRDAIVALRPVRHGHFLEFTFPGQRKLDLADLQLAPKPGRDPKKATRLSQEYMVCSKVHLGS